MLPSLAVVILIKNVLGYFVAISFGALLFIGQIVSENVLPEFTIQIDADSLYKDF